MKMKVRKGCASVIANVIRQIALTQIESIRPIAISVGNSSNVITSSNNVLEDMIQICSALNSLTFVKTGNSSNTVFTFTTTVNKVLKASDIKTSDFCVIDNDSDKEIMHVLNENVSVTIYFRLGTNVATKNENVFYLEKAGINTDGLIVINSRHTDITNFAYTISDYDFETDEIDFNVESNIAKTEEDENAVIKHSKQLIIDILKDF